MRKPVALITGITGQDGPYLAKFLLEKGYRVVGLIRKHSNQRIDNLEYLGIDDDIDFAMGDLNDENSITSVIKSLRPAEVYNLASQSFVGATWELGKTTLETNALGPYNILNSMRLFCPHSKFFQASTSEMFGNTGHDKQDESTPFRPRSPYGISKLTAHWITVNFRESHNLYACAGILYNHESPLRGREFVTRKVTDAVARITYGLDEYVRLGNLNARRDWGYAGDYVRAMWAMLQGPAPEDFVIATGQTRTVKELVQTAFAHVGIAQWEKYVKVDPALFRPVESFTLCGDATRARDILGWEPTTSFEAMIGEMIDAEKSKISYKPK